MRKEELRSREAWVFLARSQEHARLLLEHHERILSLVRGSTPRREDVCIMRAVSQALPSSSIDDAVGLRDHQHSTKAYSHQSVSQGPSGSEFISRHTPDSRPFFDSATYLALSEGALASGPGVNISEFPTPFSLGYPPFLLPPDQTTADPHPTRQG